MTVDVRENHSRKCGGEPAVAPRLFSIDIDLQTGTALWDGDDPDEMWQGHIINTILESVLFNRE